MRRQQKSQEAFTHLVPSIICIDTQSRVCVSAGVRGCGEENEREIKDISLVCWNLESNQVT